MVKQDKITKAAKTAERMKKTQQIQKRKTRTNVHFFRPKTLKQVRNPRAPKTSVSRINNMDKFKIIRAPCNSESSMKKVEEINTLVFICDRKATKSQIKNAVQQLYEVKAAKVNTMIRPDGQKKAYIRLTTDHDSLDVANKIGLL